MNALVKNLEASVRHIFVNAQVEIEDDGDRKKTYVRIVRGKEQTLLAECILSGEYQAKQALKTWVKYLDEEVTPEQKKAWKDYQVHGHQETSTHIGIWLGSLIVAECDMVGVVTEDQAMVDFMKNTNEYERKIGWQAARDLQLVA